jgi:hypothetical protein
MNPLLGGLLGNLAGNYLSDKEDGTIWDKLGFSSANAQSPETMTDPMAQVGGQPHVNMPFTQPVTDKQVVQPFTPQIQNSVNQTPPVEEPSFMDKAGDFFGDEERMARMTIALNSMRLNPDASLAKSMENKLTRLGKNKEANKSIAWLRQNATPENQYGKYADLIEKNPSMAAELMKQVMGIGKGGFKTSAVQTDPVTGQQYVVKTNPSDGSVIRENVEGATGTTYQEKLKQESTEDLSKIDRQNAMTASQDAFTEAQAMRGNVRELYNMIPLLEAGADTGILKQFLPAFDASTAQLRSLGNKMGINVINMATFGALSEKELNLALKTAIDLSLPPAELKKQIAMKINAQEKLMNELYKNAQTLSSGGMGFNEYIQNVAKEQQRAYGLRYGALNEAEKSSVNSDVWSELPLDDRERFIKARGK